MPEYEKNEKNKPPLKGISHVPLAKTPNEDGDFPFRMGGLITQRFTDEDGKLVLTASIIGVSTVGPLRWEFEDSKEYAYIKLDENREMTAYLYEQPEQILERIRNSK